MAGTQPLVCVHGRSTGCTTVAVSVPAVHGYASAGLLLHALSASGENLSMACIECSGSCATSKVLALVMNKFLLWSSLRQVGVQRHNITTLALGLAYMAGALLAFYLERMLSRKALLTSSWVGQGLALMCVSSASRDGIGGGTLVAGCIIAALAFGVGAGPPSTLNKQELNPSHIKGVCSNATSERS